ncbi:MAG: hypothetical protein PHS31_04365 [Victivallaceae bacterium]|nr:hypothetical protein [Victivallaceae bacterium]
MSNSDWTLHPRHVLIEYVLSELFLDESEEDMLTVILMDGEPITKTYAKKLENLFGRPASFWLKLQANFDSDKEHGKEVLL